VSVAENKNQLPNLTPEERREIVRAIAAIDQPQPTAPRKAESFAEARAYVFENYGDLLRRLAQ